MKNKIINEMGVLINCEQIAENLAWLSIAAPEMAATALPGQFLTILPPAHLRSLLRRPFSIASTLNDQISLLVKPVGIVTQELCRLAQNSALELLGPVGTPYPPLEGKLWTLAGGSGAASLIFLAKARHELGLPGRFLWGAKTASHLPPASKIGVDYVPATDDGSLGETGTVGTVLKRWLERDRPDAIFACGPEPMLRELKEIILSRKISAWFSIEQFMACGVGACHGCVVTLANGEYARTCVDGPIFPAEEIAL